MHGASALVYPSLCEGFGLPILEALALGTTVVVSESAVPNVLRKQCTVLPATDIAAWQHALSELRPSTSEERQARRAYSRAFTWDRCAQATADCYRELLEER